ncbi:TetR family transcriptional regulator C-terminal domain-containing protein [Streptomyces yangpuensis]|uniref:TetR family transcriptional regulator C-terminal domain-containing protein n=1 Tax=Streptomyces yangpuensis TaxID=1648182 RepID=UPI00369F13B9
MSVVRHIGPGGGDRGLGTQGRIRVGRVGDDLAAGGRHGRVRPRCRRRASPRGRLRHGTHCEAVGREILAVLDGLQTQWVLAPESVDMAARLRGYLDRLLRELSPR